jgi:hypothetical protein
MIVYEKREKITYKRRSLTIREENDKKIQCMRSQFLYYNIDIDYTAMVNIFIELGDMAFRPGTYNMTNIADIFKKYMKDRDIDKCRLLKFDDVILQVLNDYKNRNMTK